jgi:hypothetical protein
MDLAWEVRTGANSGPLAAERAEAVPTPHRGDAGGIGHPQVATAETRGETDPEMGELRAAGGTSQLIFLEDPSGNYLDVSTGSCRFLTRG